VLDKLREDLENKKYLIDQRFGRPVTLVIEFRSARTRKVGPTAHLRKTHSYPVHLDETVTRTGPNGETMTIEFIRLIDLDAMYREMGQRFFERNIRAALPEDEAVNRSSQQSLKRIAIDGKEDPQVFAFNHNGVTLFAEALSVTDGRFKLTEPRLLNGAQTVTTFARFLKANERNDVLTDRNRVLEDIRVMCRIITDATPEFVTTVTINNNRQNPVDPWNLHGAIVKSCGLSEIRQRPSSASSVARSALHPGNSRRRVRAARARPRRCDASGLRQLAAA
jgi:hypothetical protein